ncbi:DNA alkylation repair protein [Oceanithermus sp.]
MAKNNAAEVLARLRELGSSAAAARAAGYFKADPAAPPSEETFLGIRVPVLRRLARQLRDLPQEEVVRLLRTPVHEARLLALYLLVNRYQRAGEAEKEQLYHPYLENLDQVNRWDLVDASAPHILGAHLYDRDPAPLFELAASENPWKRRAAMVATLYFVRQGEPETALRLAESLLDDKSEFVHKAVGWLLREVGKRDPQKLRGFLAKHHRRMPRVTLRYAIERLPVEERGRWLAR